MSEKNAVSYEFGFYRLEARERITLWHGADEEVKLSPVQRDVLLMLVRNHPQTVPKQELYKPLRSDNPQHLAKCIYDLRHKLKHKKLNRPYILPDPGVGYMF